jgi:hypothetical protein
MAQNEQRGQYPLRMTACAHAAKKTTTSSTEFDFGTTERKHCWVSRLAGVAIINGRRD